MSFNYLLESDMYKRPFELSRVQSASQGPMAGVQGFQQGASFGMGMMEHHQNMVAKDIEIGVGQLKAQEAQMRLAAMDQELMVGMNKEAYLSARAQRKLLEANVKSQLQELELNKKSEGIKNSSRLQQAMMALSGRINAEGMTGPNGPYKKVIDYKNGKPSLRPETEDEYRKRAESEARKAEGEELDIEGKQMDLMLGQARINAYQKGGRSGMEGISKQQKLFADTASKTPVPGKPGYVYVPMVKENGTIGMRPETQQEHSVRVKDEEIKNLTEALSGIGKKGEFSDPNSQTERYRSKIIKRLSELQGLPSEGGSQSYQGNPNNYSPTGRGKTNRTWEPSESVARVALPALKSTMSDYAFRKKLDFLKDEFSTDQITRFLLFQSERFVAENDRLRGGGGGSEIVKMTSKTAFMRMISQMAKNPSGTRKALRAFFK